jgi:hypothetical protein
LFVGEGGGEAAQGDIKGADEEEEQVAAAEGACGESGLFSSDFLEGDEVKKTWGPEEDVEEEDEWEKGEASDDWDPDFDEFDIPKSSPKKATGKKTAKDEEDDFKIEDDFKDLGFDDLDGGAGFDDEDDDF